MKHETMLLAPGLKVVTENEIIAGDLERKVAPVTHGHDPCKMRSASDVYLVTD